MKIVGISAKLRNRTRRWHLVSVLLVCSSIAAACGSEAAGSTSPSPSAAPSAETSAVSPAETSAVSPAETSAGPTTDASAGSSVVVPDKPWRVVMVGPLSPAGNEFTATQKCGAQTEANKLGADVVQFDYQAPVNYSAPEQITVLRNVLATKPDAIVINPDDSDALQAPLEEALKAGVKVVIVLDTVTSNVDAFTASIVSDDAKAGHDAAVALAAETGDKGSVLAFGQGPGFATTQRRLDGFAAGLKETHLKDLGVQYHQGDVGKATELTAATITGNDDLAGIFDTGGTAYIGIQAALRQAGKLGSVKVIAFDADSTRVKSLMAGDLFAIVGQGIYNEGGLGVRYAVQALNGQEVPKQTVLPTAVVTAKNAADPEVARDYIYSLDCAG